MHCRALLAALIALAVAPATASADLRTIEISPDAVEQTWEGTATPGLNAGWFVDDQAGTGECGADPTTYCDDTLVHFTSPYELGESNLRVHIGDFSASDYDLRVYTSDETGAVGDYLGAPEADGNGPASAVLGTWLGDWESLTTFADPDSWYLVRVVYFTAPGHEGYTGTVSWTGNEFTPEDEGEPEAS
jgi:hypothetical protein